MSLASAKAFLVLMKRDKDLAQRLAAVKSEKEILEIVKSAGPFEFSKEEWLEVLRSQPDQELADIDLDKVSGGAEGDQVAAVMNKGIMEW